MNAEKELVTGVKMIVWILFIYCCILASLYINQRHLVFQPNAVNIFVHDVKPFEIFTYTTSEGTELKSLWYPPRDGNPTFVYFHGNAGNVEDRIYKAKYFIARGYGIALVEYHGFGGNPGIPTEQNLYADGRAAIAAIRSKGVQPNQIILYGESLGTGVAVQMAVEHPECRALLLESPYTSVTEVAAKRYWYIPVRLLLRDRFESDKKIGALKMPVLIVHGTKDNVIPLEFGKKLFTSVTAENKKLIVLEGATHQDIYNFGAEEMVHEFLDTIR